MVKPSIDVLSPVLMHMADSSEALVNEQFIADLDQDGKEDVVDVFFNSVASRYEFTLRYADNEIQKHAC